LARGTLRSLRLASLRTRERRKIGPLTVETFPLTHYSGGHGARKRPLETSGFRLSAPGGPRVAYVSDHEPSAGTRALEQEMLEGAQLAVFDAHFEDVKDQRYGHGSREHTARVARHHPGTLVLAGHIAPMFSDATLRRSVRRHARGVRNFGLAVEGSRYRWRAGGGCFERAQGEDPS
jgi:hypothetical protein